MKQTVLFLMAVLWFVGQSVWAQGTDKHSAAYISQRVDSIYSHLGHCNLDSCYCTEGYLDLMRQALGQMGEDEVLLDADHWTNAQDWSEDFSEKVKSVDILNDSTANVKVMLHNFGKDEESVLSLHFERGDWFVDDFLPSDDDEGERDYLMRTICTILWQRVGLTDPGFRDEKVGKYCYVDIDGDGYNELWLRSANDRFGVLVSMINNAQLIAIERNPQKVVFYRGAVGVNGPCGYNCESSKVVSLMNSRKYHVVEYIMTVPLELGTPIYEYYYDGRSISAVKGRQLMQRAKQEKISVKPIWHEIVYND